MKVLRLAWATLAVLVAAHVHGQAVAVTDRGILVAESGEIRLHDLEGKVLWRIDGPYSPTTLVVSGDRAAVLDAVANRVVLVDAGTREARTVKTGETPNEALFAGDMLYVLERDASTLSSIDRQGRRQSVDVAADAAFLRLSGGRLYVYSRQAGVVQEVTRAPFAVTRRATISAHASDLEVDDRHGYLVNPSRGKLVTFSLDTLKVTAEVDVGVRPADVAVASSSSLLTAREIAVADPAAKRVWLVEGGQSLTQAVARGFLRGLLGLGLYRGRTSVFPGGVDRVWKSGRVWMAFDSSRGTVYRVRRSSAGVAAENVAAVSFTDELTAALTRDGRVIVLR